ncbi:MAG TPA: tetraacyldisaccharide 4'-kinase [Geobacteraceae bacterium]
MASLERFYRELAEGTATGPAALLARAFLGIAAAPYGVAMAVRARLYASGILTSRQLPRPVVAVGNLTVGGTGKTPMTALIARLFMARGKRVVVLSRGYGGTLHGRGEHVVADGSRILLGPEESGDEPYLLATSVPGLIVVVGADRYRAGCLALERLEPDVFLLDDGFQHLRLRRDLNILLLDCRRPFGNGRVFPAGLLREPRSAVGRADLIVYTRCPEGATPPDIPGIPACRAEHRLTGIVPLGGGGLRPFDELTGKRGVACAGIANPDGFFAALREQGLTLAATLALPDHCRYREGEMAAVRRLIEGADADYLVTTGKDGVKLLSRRQDLGPVWVSELELRLDDATPLHAAAEHILCT